MTGERNAVGDAAGGEDFSEEQFAAGLDLDAGGLANAALLLRDEHGGGVVEPRIFANAEGLADLGAAVGHGVHAAGAGGGDAETGAGLDGDFAAQSVARKQAGGGVDDLRDKSAAVPVRFAEMERDGDRLPADAAAAGVGGGAGQFQMAGQLGH